MTEHHDVTCPFCGMACDDLAVWSADGAVRVTANGCALARRRFAEASGATDPGPRVGGQSAALDEAVQRAAELLRAARLPVIAGLAADVNGARAAVRFAERCGGVLDHANSPAFLSNVRVVQTSGWFTATFTEVRNRADLIVVVGEDLFALFPRLLERVLAPPVSLLPEAAARREFILIGPWRSERLPPELPAARTTIIDIPKPGFADALGVVRALLAGRELTVDAARLPLAHLAELAGRLRNARYAVLAWGAGDLDATQRDLTVSHLVEIVRQLNVKTRAVGLPLGGSAGDLTANQVCTWQTGYPLRVGFAKGYPEFDPVAYDSRALLAGGEADALVWIAALAPDLAPPASTVPTIVLGHPALICSREPEVFIPVGVPGIDHAGHYFRSDNVVALPLRRLRDPRWPTAAEVLGRIQRQLETPP